MKGRHRLASWISRDNEWRLKERFKRKSIKIVTLKFFIEEKDKWKDIVEFMCISQFLHMKLIPVIIFK